MYNLETRCNLVRSRVRNDLRVGNQSFIRHRIAKVAHLVEHDLAKVGVASSSLVFRSWDSDGSPQEE